MTAKRLRVSSNCSMLGHRWGCGEEERASLVCCFQFSACASVCERVCRERRLMDFRCTELELLELLVHNALSLLVYIFFFVFF